MSVIQISKIQVRRGLKFELPGQPTIPGDPATLTPSLDIGEFGFATDTSALFIGGDPTALTTQRTTFPYQNIEVLTEYSDKIRPFLTQTTILNGPTLTQTPTGLVLPCSGDGVNPGNGATIKYTLLEVGGTRMRHGDVYIITDGQVGGVSSISDSFVAPFFDLSVEFFINVTSATSYSIDFTNAIGSQFRFFYRVL